MEARPGGDRVARAAGFGCLTVDRDQTGQAQGVGPAVLASVRHIRHADGRQVGSRGRHSSAQEAVNTRGQRGLVGQRTGRV